jgi:hypothetical protein
MSSLTDPIEAYLENEYCLQQDKKNKSSRPLQTTESRPGRQIIEHHGNLMMMMTMPIIGLTVRINFIVLHSRFLFRPGDRK